MKHFFLGVLLTTTLLGGFFGFCPYAEEIMVKRDKPKANTIQCDMVIRLVIDGVEKDKIIKPKGPGSFILEDAKP